MECKKCKEQASVTLRKKDFYCQSCFMANVNHKFRSNLGKNRVFSPNEKVLVAVSGGLGSAVLLDFIHNAVTLNTHKVLKVNPVCVHVTGIYADPEKDNEITKEVINICKRYNMDVFITNISTYILNQEDTPTFIKNSLPIVPVEAVKKFLQRVSIMEATERTDFILKVIRNLLKKCVEKFRLSFVITGETSSTLASRLLSNLALGRGSQIQSDIGFADDRNPMVTILRPMKDITTEELEIYAKIMNVTSTCSLTPKPDKSVQNVIQAFVKDLQENFPATISTVCKTADKIGQSNLNKMKCHFCEVQSPSDISERPRYSNISEQQ